MESSEGQDPTTQPPGPPSPNDETQRPLKPVEPSDDGVSMRAPRHTRTRYTKPERVKSGRTERRKGDR